jgi:hypothetical protein
MENSQAWWYQTVIPALRRLGYKDGKLEPNLHYTARSCLKKKKKKKKS